MKETPETRQLHQRVRALLEAGTVVPCTHPAVWRRWTSDDPQGRQAAVYGCQPCPLITICRTTATVAKARAGVWGAHDFTR